MTIKQLKEQIKDLSDDMEVFIEQNGTKYDITDAKTANVIQGEELETKNIKSFLVISD